MLMVTRNSRIEWITGNVFLTPGITGVITATSARAMSTVVIKRGLSRFPVKRIRCVLRSLRIKQPVGYTVYSLKGMWILEYWNNGSLLWCTDL